MTGESVTYPENPLQMNLASHAQLASDGGLEVLLRSPKREDRIRTQILIKKMKKNEEKPYR